ncbi:MULTISPECIES: hypothetical protein [unclassified Streptomyces]|uniref:hypothetical protein n=1 Tax=unclassified Streptomyces TaxID=2593676 RepID=UPI003319321E
MLDTTTGNGTTGTGSPVDGIVREAARRGAHVPALAVGDGAPDFRRVTNAPRPAGRTGARRGRGRLVGRPEEAAA